MTSTVANIISERMKLIILIALLLTIASVRHANGQERRSLPALRMDDPITVDGALDESAWEKAVAATDFIIYSPYNGVLSRFRTEVRVLYDDDALYIGAMMYDDHPDSIFSELGQRDAGDINADHFYVEISPFNDGLNGEMFKVSASNVQIDNKLTTGDSWEHQDTWDAVWNSRTQIGTDGWSAELMIPYSALRFPKSSSQVWGINFWREVRRVRETSSWNFVTREFGGTIAHLGELTGIADIKPPLRLSLVPYVSGYLEHGTEQQGVGTSWNGGLDLKLGLSESFTLDATLIPDFGQVLSDDRILNLTPYEVKYNEKRPFFMEGTELFNRGNIFYSRRIGGTPHLVGDVHDMAEPGEIFTSNPAEVSLLNATKVSGRTHGGLGIGLFNAVTSGMYAELRDTVTGATRRVMTEPLTNYNMMVLDQTLNNDSYVSLANTNVIRAAEKDEHFYTANVTAIEALLKTRNRLYSASAAVALSQKYYSAAETGLGHSVSLNIGKTGGKFRTDYDFSVVSDSYDPNDMGYLRRNNELEQSVDFSYNTYEPRGNIMTTRSSVDLNYDQLYKPRAFTSASVSLSEMIILMNYWSFSVDMQFTPWGEDDYFEPRTRDMSKFYHRPAAFETSFRGDTDKSKKLYAELQGEYYKAWSEFNQHGFAWSLQSEYKVNRRFSIQYSLSMERMFNDIGYVMINPADMTIFGRRNIKTVTNTLSGAFIFSANSYLTLRGRHYWSGADYDNSYFELMDDGSLRKLLTPDVMINNDVNTNFLNVDVVYTWRFAPGSELSLVWKNAIYSEGNVIVSDALGNFSDLLSMPQTNSLSLKILYYLDYQNFKKLFSAR